MIINILVQPEVKLILFLLINYNLVDFFLLG